MYGVSQDSDLIWFGLTFYNLNTMHESLINERFSFIEKLSWAPSFVWKLNFCYNTQPTQLKLLKPSSDHSHGSTEFPIQNLSQIGQGAHEF